MRRRVLIGVGVVLSLLIVAVGVLYAFGRPTSAPPLAPASAAEKQTAEKDAAARPDAAGAPGASGGPAADGAATAATGEAPPPDPSTPLAIEIPGCVCHSDDPKLVKEHEAYRMNQCVGCHAGGVPTGQ